MMTRRAWGALAGAGLLEAQAPTESKVSWKDGRSLTVEGLGFKDSKSPWERFPARAEGVVRPEVWNLSLQPAGALLRFETDGTEIHARWRVRNATLTGPTNTAVASSGLDLYVRHNGQWRWLAIGRPTAQASEQRLIAGLKPGRREYMLYLPLHNALEALEIGVAPEAKLEAAALRTAKPIVFYGTSITHGSSASRAGMIHTSILGRRFDRPVINLGFGGNGRLELEVAKFLVELDAAVYVIDCLPNITAPQVAERTVPFVEYMRKARPDTPMLLVEDRTYQDAFLVESKWKRNVESRIEFRKAYAQLLAKGVKGLAYLGGEGLLGADGEATIDSSHPTDLGFVRQADAFEPFLAAWLRP